MSLLIFDRDNTLGAIDRVHFKATGGEIRFTENPGAGAMLARFRAARSTLCLVTLGSTVAIEECNRAAGFEGAFDHTFGMEDMLSYGSKVATVEATVGASAMQYALLIGNVADVVQSKPEVPVLLVQSDPALDVTWETVRVYRFAQALFKPHEPTSVVFDALQQTGKLPREPWYRSVPAWGQGKPLEEFWVNEQKVPPSVYGGVAALVSLYDRPYLFATLQPTAEGRPHVERVHIREGVPPRDLERRIIVPC